MPVEAIDPGNSEFLLNDMISHYLARLRRDDPVHYCNGAIWGPYCSITRFHDIMHVDTNYATFSSSRAHGAITLFNAPAVDDRLQIFIAIDPPEHERQRAAVSQMFAPDNHAKMEELIRERTSKVRDELPRGETFNWADRVSIELTSLMLAALFDFPVEERHLLVHWSDVATSNKLADPNAPSEDEIKAELDQMLGYFSELWRKRAGAEAKFDIFSMLVHSPETRNMTSREMMGSLVLLIIGCNDTTRHSKTGGLLAQHENPDEMSKLRSNLKLIDTLVPEFIRWQTPLAHMRRTAVCDAELCGHKILAGEKVVIGYLSGNRDEEAIAEAHRFITHRPRAPQHLSFGFGLHRCLGNRLAELQLRVLWEEILRRFPVIEVVGSLVRLRSAFVRGFSELPVRIPA